MANTTYYSLDSSRISDVIKKLQQIQDEHGDIDIMITNNDLSHTFVRECYIEYYYNNKVVELY